MYVACCHCASACIRNQTVRRVISLERWSFSANGRLVFHVNHERDLVDWVPPLVSREARPVEGPHDDMHVFLNSDRMSTLLSFNKFQHLPSFLEGLKGEGRCHLPVDIIVNIRTTTFCLVFFDNGNIFISKDTNYTQTLQQRLVSP
jgi:hypothetical protein